MINKRHFLQSITLVILLIASLPINAQRSYEGKYDKEHPLIIAGDWDKPPYEYQNDRGEPAGSNIDVMRAVMKQLGIPCKFLLKEWGNAIKAFERGEADLILANAHRYKKAPYYYSRNIINYNRIRVLMRGDTIPSLSLRQLIEGGVVLKPSDYTLAYFLAEDADYINHIEFQSPKVAMLGLRDNDYKFFVWGEEPLKWKMKELGFGQEDFALNEINIPVSDIHVIGRDKDLINEIDDIYSRLKQSGEVEAINTRWFHPEKISVRQQIPMSVIIILAIILLVAFCYLLTRLAQSHAKKASHNSMELNEMMYKALHLGRFYVMQYDIANNQFTNRYGTFLPNKGMSLEEFVAHIHPKEQEEFKNKMNLMETGREQKTSIDKRWNTGTAENPKWLNFKGHSLVEYDDYGHPTYIINTINDITENIEEEKTAHDLVKKYERLSNMPQLAMSFYNKNGSLIDANDSMKALCEFDKPENERYFRHSSMFDIPIFHDIYPQGSKEAKAACQRMDKPYADKDTYIEYEVRPLLDEQGNVINYIVSAMDATEEHDRDVSMHKMNHEVQTAINQMNQLEQQLQYILKNTNMYVWRLNYDKKTIEYTRYLRKSEHTITFEEYYDCVDDDERSAVKKGLETPNMWDKPFYLERHFKKPLFSTEGSEKWYNISGFPIRNEQGDVNSTFGIIRDITEQKESEQKLKEETLRAENSGQQKSMFLASMTHELRTPLNSIVGFSDLLRSIDAPEERKEFIRIIRTNCDILLRLISDIIEAANISDTQIQILPKEVDFAKEFDTMCQSLAQRVQEAKVEFIKKNPHTKLQTVLDKGRIQQVITNFVTNAVKYTQEGHICVGYRIDMRFGKKGIFVYCEDTGSGIPKDKQEMVFERFVKLNDFVQGSGLGLAICKSIVEQCGGQIGVDSEVGKGSTFWFWIPADIKEVYPTPSAHILS
ncbi:MAG: transporter substrate-binding domain-containing protein [Prevotella sp.]|nr:transporter substrate-binding domain-containing protein [Prevotella sp.]